jgi:hypothetical protein
MADELTVSADATTDDAATFGLTGAGQFPTRVTAPAIPAAIPGDLIMPGAMQLWIDTASAIGTTEITGRFIKTDWTLPTGVTYKNYANGPAGGLNFTKTGRTKRHAEASIEVELNDLSIARGQRVSDLGGGHGRENADPPERRGDRNRRRADHLLQLCAA